MTMPIRPDEVQKTIPDEIIEIFNALISENWDGCSAVIKQDTIVESIMERMEIKRETIFEKRYLDIEDIYKKVGWKVFYDKPGYNEAPYPCIFIFRKD